ncbi:hypothetical protein BTA51_20535 [Hahella sp. CCB-MM4]|uniref:carbohydrate-binding protein n=1 Tax=Hahella sp. (strain CCB-MM4) TaxID=1926491 RepID=UPI000B9C533B|nr:carbohydrate-binding protein [Hahella sp. CCB-MM4]OZG71343.1 hypothetical protein BTA51_20535 [Hahella sp. CCB-MM4]
MKRSTILLPFIFGLLTTLMGTSALADEVSLIKADSRIHGRYGFSWQTYTADILIENIARDKKVSMQYLDDDGQWKRQDARFDHMIDNNKEVWRISETRMLHHPNEPTQQPLNLTFALEYEVDGTVFWDNNHEQNYFLPADSGEYIGSNIQVDYAGALAPYDAQYGENSTHFDGRFSVGVLLKNLGYAKDVKVHYTLDNWKTTYVKDLTFQYGRLVGYSWVTYPNANGVEYWSMTSTGEEMQDPTSNIVEYAVSYQVNGDTYWDNNFGRNYQIDIIHR